MAVTTTGGAHQKIIVSGTGGETISTVIAQLITDGEIVDNFVEKRDGDIYVIKEGITIQGKFTKEAGEIFVIPSLKRFVFGENGHLVLKGRGGIIYTGNPSGNGLDASSTWVNNFRLDALPINGQKPAFVLKRTPVTAGNDVRQDIGAFGETSNLHPDSNIQGLIWDIYITNIGSHKLYFQTGATIKGVELLYDPNYAGTTGGLQFNGGVIDDLRINLPSSAVYIPLNSHEIKTTTLNSPIIIVSGNNSLALGGFMWGGRWIIHNAKILLNGNFTETDWLTGWNQQSLTWGNMATPGSTGGPPNAALNERTGYGPKFTYDVNINYTIGATKIQDIKSTFTFLNVEAGTEGNYPSRLSNTDGEISVKVQHQKNITDVITNYRHTIQTRGFLDRPVQEYLITDSQIKSVRNISVACEDVRDRFIETDKAIINAYTGIFVGSGDTEATRLVEISGIVTLDQLHDYLYLKSIETTSAGFGAHAGIDLSEVTDKWLIKTNFLNDDTSTLDIGIYKFIAGENGHLTTGTKYTSLKTDVTATIAAGATNASIDVPFSDMTSDSAVEIKGLPTGTTITIRNEADTATIATGVIPFIYKYIHQENTKYLIKVEYTEDGIEKTSSVKYTSKIGLDNSVNLKVGALETVNLNTLLDQVKGRIETSDILAKVNPHADAPTSVNVNGFSPEFNGEYIKVTNTQDLIFADGFNPLTGSASVDLTKPVYLKDDIYLWVRQGSGYHLSKATPNSIWYYEFINNPTDTFKNFPSNIELWSSMIGNAVIGTPPTRILNAKVTITKQNTLNNDNSTIVVQNFSSSLFATTNDEVNGQYVQIKDKENLVASLGYNFDQSSTENPLIDKTKPIWKNNRDFYIFNIIDRGWHLGKLGANADMSYWFREIFINAANLKDNPIIIDHTQWEALNQNGGTPTDGNNAISTNAKITVTPTDIESISRDIQKIADNLIGTTVIYVTGFNNNEVNGPYTLQSGVIPAFHERFHLKTGERLEPSTTVFSNGKGHYIWRSGSDAPNWRISKANDAANGGSDIWYMKTGAGLIPDSPLLIEKGQWNRILGTASSYTPILLPNSMVYNSSFNLIKDIIDENTKYSQFPTTVNVKGISDEYNGEYTRDDILNGVVFDASFTPGGFATVIDLSKPVYRKGNYFLWPRENSGYHLSTISTTGTWYYEYLSNPQEQFGRTPYETILWSSITGPAVAGRPPEKVPTANITVNEINTPNISDDTIILKNFGQIGHTIIGDINGVYTKVGNPSSIVASELFNSNYAATEGPKIDTNRDIWQNGKGYFIWRDEIFGWRISKLDNAEAWFREASSTLKDKPILIETLDWEFCSTRLSSVFSPTTPNINPNARIDNSTIDIASLQDVIVGHLESMKQPSILYATGFNDPKVDGPYYTITGSVRINIYYSQNKTSTEVSMGQIWKNENDMYIWRSFSNSTYRITPSNPPFGVDPVPPWYMVKRGLPSIQESPFIVEKGNWVKAEGENIDSTSPTTTALPDSKIYTTSSEQLKGLMENMSEEQLKEIKKAITIGSQI